MKFVIIAVIVGICTLGFFLGSLFEFNARKTRKDADDSANAGAVPAPPEPTASSEA